MTILTMIFGFIAKILGDVIKDALGTPAHKVNIINHDGTITIDTPVDRVLSKYDRMFEHRNED